MWGDSPGAWSVAGRHPLLLNNLDQVKTPPQPGEGESQALQKLRSEREFRAAFPDFDPNHPDAVIRVDEAREPDRDFWMKEPEPQETAAVVVSAARAARFETVGRNTDIAFEEALAAEVRSPDLTEEGKDRLPDFREGMTGVSESTTPAKESAPTPEHPWAPWSQVVQDRNASDQETEERRIDRNGQAYTWEQFQSFYKDRAAQKWYDSTVAPNPFSLWHNKK